jgi:hypothetical protein
MARIVVTGYMIRHPVAGNIYAYFHYVLGLARLGHEVVYLEESGWPSACFDPEAGEMTDRPDAGLRAVHALLEQHGTSVSVYYVDRDQGAVYGGGWADVRDALAAADLLLNVGGVCWLPEFRRAGRLALVDMDPLFTQLGRFGGEGLEHYQTYFTYGSNIGRPSCTIPLGEIDWRPTVPPVVADIWPAQGLPVPDGFGSEAERPFTTVANWNSYGGITFGGEHYGQKDEEFLRVIDLPSRTAQPLELALSGASREVEDRLREAGWRIRPADTVSNRVETYRAYLAASRGEFSVAKNAYVKTRSGWFSDRTVTYLASGRPAVVQDDGIGEWLPVGHGLLLFSTTDEAARALAAVDNEYETHRQAARQLATTYFAHDVVLPRLLEQALRPGRGRPPPERRVQ